MSPWPPGKPEPNTLQIFISRAKYRISLYWWRVKNFIKEPRWWKAPWGIPLHHGKIKFGEFTEYDWRIESAVIGLFISHMEEDNGLESIWQRQADDEIEFTKADQALLEAYNWFKFTLKARTLVLEDMRNDPNTSYNDVFDKKEELNDANTVHLMNIMKYRNYLWS
jgi:hypothetical protein